MRYQTRFNLIMFSRWTRTRLESGTFAISWMVGHRKEQQSRSHNSPMRWGDWRKRLTKLKGERYLAW